MTDVAFSRAELRMLLVWWGGYLLSGLEADDEDQFRALVRRIEAAL